MTSVDSVPVKITLVGPQNAGKSTLFNALTSSFVDTANYPGATVEYTTGAIKPIFKLNAAITDTPGLSTLTPSTPDQQITADNLFKQDHRADILIVVVDATQLARHLYFVEQMKAAGFPLIVCVTMLDLLNKRGCSLNMGALAHKLNLPCVAVDGRKQTGVANLINAIQSFKTPAQSILTNPQKSDEKLIQERYLFLEALENKVIQKNEKVSPQPSINLDDVLLHPVWGLAVFVLIMFSIFTAIFWLATPAMDMIDSLFGYVIEGTTLILPDSWVVDLLADGVIAGIGSVVIFLPQIIILFLAMGYLEDSGYLSRGAVLIDRPLSAIGLNGRSFVPLLSGFACAIPAMMAARTMINRKERLLTIFIIPLMSCSARLPVYVLLLAFLTPKDKPWIGGLALAGLYIFGILLGTIAATIISKLPSFKSRQSTFQLELPAYRRPMLKVVLRSTYQRSKNYLEKAGPIIVVISIGLWMLTHLPVNTSGSDEYVTVSQSYAATVGKVLEPVMEPMGLDWRSGVAMIMGFVAREVFVSAMALMYRIDTDDKEAVQAGLLRRMREVTFHGTTQKIFTISSCLGLIFFFTMALQCFPTVTVARNEIGGWRVPLIQLFAYTGLAYVGSIILVQGLRIMGIT